MKLHNKSGFTLVEVMVTLLIMALMMVGITQVLQSARRTRDLINNVQESQMAGPAILDLLEHDLRGIYTTNRLLLDVIRVKDNAIGGIDSDRIDFVTSSNSRLLTPNDAHTRYLRSDFNEVGYCVKTNPNYPGDFVEIWRRESFGVDEEPFEGGRFTFLHDRVRRFDILIFNEDGTEAEPLESWGIANADEKFRGLPTRIEIELELELAPRLISEQSTRMRKEKRRVVYRRVIHFPARLHLALEVRPVPRIPSIEPLSPGGTGGSGDGNGTSNQPTVEGSGDTAPNGFGGGNPFEGMSGGAPGQGETIFEFVE